MVEEISKPQEEVKKVGIQDYKATIKQGIKPNGEKCVLSIKLNDHLKNLLSSVVVKGSEVDFTYETEKLDNGTPSILGLKRYKVKTAIFSSLYKGKKQGLKDLLFSEGMVDEGVLELEFDNLGYLEETKTQIKDLIMDFLKLVLSVNLEQTIVYNVREIPDEKKVIKPLH
jgi:hypothetical protein